MKLNSTSFDSTRSRCLGGDNRSRAGLLLAECVIYLGLLFLVLGGAYAVFYGGWEDELQLRRNADQIARAMSAGERWRAEVRGASGTLRAENSGGEQIVVIPQAGGEISYRFGEGTVSRSTTDKPEWVLVLDHAAKSQMALQPRAKVQAWQWEFELASREKRRRVHPLFTFIAVPGPAQASK